MEPAITIITRLGGPTEVARTLGVHRTRVSNWKRGRAVGGTGGMIPQKHIPALLRLAETKGVPLAAADFLPPSIPASAPIPATA